MRVMLAKMMLQAPDLLLLDEPTNHLDLPSIQWLEDYLQDYKATVVIVSHDRYFLDKVVNRTVEIANQKITVYPGNYSYYLEQKQEREDLQRSQFKNQEKYIKEQERGRALYYNFYTGKKWGFSTSYDLCIDSSVLGIKATADYIAEFIRQRFKCSGEKGAIQKEKEQE